jgi:8-oxo-dGTP pyrophosphatase MutT (NUDIX family)
LADVVAGKPAATFERPRSGQPPSDGGYILDLRRRFGPGLLITPGSGAIVRNDGGKILLIQRSDNGQWAYPGGYVDVGESAAEAAVREAYEEAGVVVEVKRLVGAYTGPDHQVTYANGDQAQFASAVFDCQWQSGEPRTDGVETVTVGWFPPDPSAWPNPMNKRVRRRLLEALSARPEAYFQ